MWPTKIGGMLAPEAGSQLQSGQSALLLTLVVAALLIAGCGEDGAVGDAGVDGTEDGAACPAPSAYGDLGIVDGAAWGAPLLYAPLPGSGDINATIDLTGLVREDLGSGTYELSGDELDPATCRTCVSLFYFSELARPKFQYYWVTRGVLVVSDLTSTHMAGSLSDAAFVHIRGLDDPTPAADGCESSVEHLEFDATVQQD